MAIQNIYSPYQQYQRQKDNEVRVASPTKIISMLLEAAIMHNKKALMALEEDRKVKALENVTHASEIVSHLYECLDFDRGGKISEQLGSLYSYVLNEYVNFMRKDKYNPELLKSVNNVLSILLDGWKQIEEQQNKEGQNDPQSD